MTLTGLRQLEVICVSGPIPDSLGDLTNLWILSLVDNQLSGPVPDSLGDLPDVWILSLEGNDLTVPLPRGREETPEWFDRAIRDHTSRITPDQWTAHCLNNNL